MHFETITLYQQNKSKVGATRLCLLTSISKPLYDQRLKSEHRHCITLTQLSPPLLISDTQAQSQGLRKNTEEFDSHLTNQNQHGLQDDCSSPDLESQSDSDYEGQDLLIEEGQKDCIKMKAALNYLQTIGKQRRNHQQTNCLANDELQNLDLTRKSSLSQPAISRNHSAPFEHSEDVSTHDNNIQSDKIFHMTKPLIPQNSQQQQETSEFNESIRSSYKRQRKHSIYEQTLCFILRKKSSKVETVQHLINNSGANNQWAFNFKQNGQDPLNPKKSGYEESLVNFQKQGLRSLALSLNNLDQAIETKVQSLDQVSLKDDNSTRERTRHLKLQVKLCEKKKESLSDIQEIWTPNEQSDTNKMLNRTSRTYRKEYNLPEEMYSLGFSDAISTLSKRKKASKEVKLDERSLRGIYDNIRKLTEDILQSDEDSFSGSLDKISPNSSFDKKYRQFVSNMRQGEENISSYSTTNKSPIKNVSFIGGKLLNKDIDKGINEASTSIIKRSSCQQISSYLYDSGVTRIGQGNAPYKHKSGVVHHNQVTEMTTNEQYQSSHYDSINKKDFVDEAFDFETRDFLEDQDCGSRNENSNYGNYVRKYTQDDSIKQPILGQKNGVEINQQYNIRRR